MKKMMHVLAGEKNVEYADHGVWWTRDQIRVSFTGGYKWIQYECELCEQYSAHKWADAAKGLAEFRDYHGGCNK